MGVTPSRVASIIAAGVKPDVVTKNSPIGAPGKCATELSYFPWTNVISVAFALENRLHADKIIEPEYPSAVDAAVARSTLDLHLREAGFS